ncbi:MAG TPA: hypothetical protein PLF26_01055 [Blastocatellia bacterium]|nr:hypothetical protein [Blastocatellia bacterium]
MKKLVARCLLLMLVIAAVSAALLAVDTWTDVEVVGPKLAYFQIHASDYDTVFVGSSYFFREISPAEFDRATAARAPTRSFNFGVPGMDPPETYFVVDRILSTNAAHLKYVVVELDYFREKVRPRNVHSRRFDYWHDWVRTGEAVRGVAESPVSWRKRAKDAATHVEAFARRFLNVGRGRAYIERFAAAFGRQGDETAALGADDDGFVSLDDDQSDITDVRRGFYSAFEEDRYAEKLEQLKEAAVADDEGDSGVGRIDVEALRRTVARIKAAGARPILVVPPCLATRADLVRLRDQGVIEDLLVFNDPLRYPELYATEHRFDVGHLNKAGAAVFTNLLADRFLELVAGQ